FFFSSRRRHTRFSRDWSSDVCSSDLASVAMHYLPASEGDKAGLAAFQNDEYYYFLGVARTAEGTVIQLEKRAGGDPEIVASRPRSEERRVGKECRSRRTGGQAKRNRS